SQAVDGFGIEGQGWDEMLAGQKWESAGEIASVVVGALVAEPPGGPVVVNVPNSPVAEMSGWQSTTIGRIPPRVMSEAVLEPKIGHPGSYRVAMRWGDPVSLPDGTDGGAVERGRVSLTLLGAITDRHSPDDRSADVDA